MKEITLATEEWQYAETVGRARYAYARKKGLRDEKTAERLEAREDKGARDHVNGALSEIAFGKATNRYWHPNVGITGLPDFPPNLEIKSSDNPHGNLLVYPDELDPGCLYFLAVVLPGHRVQLWGWFAGDQIPVRGYVHPARGSWCVKRKYLAPMDRWLSEVE